MSHRKYIVAKEYLLRKSDSDMKSAIFSLFHAQSNVFVYLIQQYMSTAIENAKKFQIEINNVSEALKQIEQISLKTRILSINSSIEAAHADMAGKGFSVIAKEIGALSEQTKACTDKVNEIDKELVSDFEVERKSSEQLESYIRVFSESNDKVMGDVSEFSTIEENGFVITTLAKRLENHADFMRNLLKNAGTRNKIADHHSCAFGQWYDANKGNYAHMPEYVSVFETHKDFHDAASDFNNTGNIDALIRLYTYSHEILVKFLNLAASFKKEIQMGSGVYNI